jgi:hypothetical protein
MNRPFEVTILGYTIGRCSHKGIVDNNLLIFFNFFPAIDVNLPVCEELNFYIDKGDFCWTNDYEKWEIKSLHLGNLNGIII